jgi:hypothetical protein
MSNIWIERGQVIGNRKTLIKQLEKRFGPLCEESREQITTATSERLEELLLAVLDAHSLEELGLKN